MSSLSGAPSLTTKKPPITFNYDLPPAGAVEDEDDLFPSHLAPAVASSSVASKKEVEKPQRTSSSEKKKDKEKKKSKKDKSGSSGSGAKLSSGHTGTSDHAADNYSDDFVEEPVTSVPSPADIERERAKLRAEAEAARKAEDERMRQERESHERRMREWGRREEQHDLPSRSSTPKLVGDRARKESPVNPPRASSSLDAQQIQAAAASAPAASNLNEQLLQMLQQQIFLQQQQQANMAAAAAAAAAASAAQTAEGQPETAHSGEDRVLPADKERDRRRRRERERDRDLRRAHEEEAAHSLFHKLAKDVREVFHELNMAVVAAEKERLLKDERYRKEREMRDRREDLDRQERAEKERKEREDRDERYWKQMEERESRMSELLLMKLSREERDREERAKRDEVERGERFRSDKELRDHLEKQDRERRDREESAGRERDRLQLQAQLDEVKRQYQQQMEEMRRQFDLDRAHIQEIHKLEVAAMEKRHVEAASLTEKHHHEQLALMDLHTANASRLEQLIGAANSELIATQQLNEQVTRERLAMLKDREKEIDGQKELVQTVLHEVHSIRDNLNTERLRIASLYAQFDLAIKAFVKETGEERAKLREAQAHFDTLRMSLEKDRKQMLHEIAQERKMLEQQHDEFVERKMSSMSELQAERMAVMKERSEFTLMRERQNRDETAILASLRSRDEELSSKLEAIETDRQISAESKREAQRLLQEAQAERETIRRERNVFELEKAEVMHRIEDVTRRAEDARESQERMRKELASERTAHIDVHRALGPLGSNHAGRPPTVGGYLMGQNTSSLMQLELAKQRAVLNRISEDS
jgi:hypothetical protein